MRYCAACGLDFTDGGIGSQPSAAAATVRTVTARRPLNWPLAVAVVLVVVGVAGGAGLWISTLPSGMLPASRGLFAPDNLAATIPRVVDGTRIDVERVDVETRLSESDLEAIGEVAVATGKEIGDVSMAAGQSSDGAVYIVAFRVSGVEGSQLYDTMLNILFDEQTRPPEEALSSWVIGGKDVRRYEYDDGDGAQLFYPKGEVLYVIAAPDGGDEDLARSIVEALP